MFKRKTIINFLSDHNNKQDEVYEFCQQNDIQITWDFDEHTRECWNEIMFDGKLIIQIQQGINLSQFLNFISILSNNFDAKEIPDDGIKYWAWKTDEKDLFERFVQRYADVFKITAS